MNTPSKTGKIDRDLWGVWVNRLVRKQQLCMEKAWSLYSRMKCSIWKIHLGKNCLFWGNMHFGRAPQSDIIVGDECRFRSASWSNMVGINRPCILCTLRGGAKIKIGKRSGFSGTVISAAQSIEIGDDVLCGANVTITDTDWHHIDRAMEGKENAPCAPVVIGDNVWLGLNVTILKGVSIGKGSVIAPYSVVTKDIPEGVLAGGQPAKVIKKI